MKKNVMEFCLMMAIVGLIVLGGFLIWHILFYIPPPPSNLSVNESCLLMLSFGLMLGFVIHGVNPLLIFKSESSSSQNNKTYKS